MRVMDWLRCGVVAASLMAAVGCGESNSTTAPTPTPAPAPTPTPTPTPPPTPAAPAALESLAVSPSSVEGQTSPTGTVTLTAAAPAGGALIQLQSGDTDAAKVPSSVTVAAGATSATFTIDTSTVNVPHQATIQATYAGVTKTFVLTVRSPELIPRFTITSASKGEKACSIINSDGRVDCVFDATTSGGFIGKYVYTLKVGDRETVFETGNPNFTPLTTCDNLQSAGGLNDGYISVTVSLVVEDRAGNRSANNTIVGAGIFPVGRCGYN